MLYSKSLVHVHFFQDQAISFDDSYIFLAIKLKGAPRSALCFFKKLQKSGPKVHFIK